MPELARPHGPRTNTIHPTRRFTPIGRVQMDRAAGFKWNARPGSVDCVL